MKCACGKPNCSHEVYIDSDDGILLTEKEILINGNKTHESILLFMDEKMIDEMIQQLMTAKLNIERKKKANAN